MCKNGKKQRDAYFDFLKGILILLVLLGHGIQYGNGNTYYVMEDYWNNPIMKAIYSFHMPLFAAVSGYFSFFSVGRKPFLGTCAGRWVRLATPVAVWSLLTFACRAVLGEENLSVKSILYAMLYHSWFIWAVLIGFCMICAISRIGSKPIRYAVYGGVFVAGMLTPDFIWVGAAVKYIVFYQFLGYELASVGWHPKRITLRAALVGSILWILLLLLYNKDSYIYTSLFSVIGSEEPVKQVWIDLYRNGIGVVGGFSFCGLTWLVWTWIQGKDGWMKRLFMYMGRHSLAVYMLSTPMLMYLIPTLTFGWRPSLWGTMLVAMATGLSCMGIIAVLRKNKWTTRILLGE